VSFADAIQEDDMRRRPEGSWPTALAGSLEHVGITTVLTLLGMERRTGMIEVRSAGRVGRLALREGCVVRATVNRAPLPDCEAVCQFLSWNEGRFVFRVGEVEAGEGAPRTTVQLLLEAARRADENAAA
jgi:hypothetical protein